jgi:uncharacterized protein
MLAHGEWLLTPERAAIHLATATAVIADLHLGYSDARRGSGEAVPSMGLEDLLQPLGRTLTAHDVRRLVIAGDLFEKCYCDALAAELLCWLECANVALAAVIPGNHDRGLINHGVRLPVFVDGIRLGGWHVAHGDGKLPQRRAICGHYHPCLRLGRIMSPCFLIGPRRVLLPAYSEDARGVNVLGVASWQRLRCGIPVGGDVLDFGEVRDLRQSSRCERLTR